MVDNFSPSGTDITLSHPNVNGGNDVELNGARVSYAWKNFVHGKPISGYGDIAEKGQNGFENPVLTIQGVWDIDEQVDLNTPATRSTHSNPAGNEKICQKLLVDFATLQSTTPMTLTIISGQNEVALGGRPTDGYSSGSNTLLGYFNVAIVDFKILFGTKIKEGQKWDYSITLTETT